jgi:hypothetical protein
MAGIEALYLEDRKADEEGDRAGKNSLRNREGRTL